MELEPNGLVPFPNGIYPEVILVTPVPPAPTAMVVPLHVPAVIVPTVAISVPINFEAVILPANFTFVILPSETPAAAVCAST